MSRMFVHALSITPPSSSVGRKDDSVWVCGGGPGEVCYDVLILWRSKVTSSLQSSSRHGGTNISLLYMSLFFVSSPLYAG